MKCTNNPQNRDTKLKEQKERRKEKVKSHKNQKQQANWELLLL